jgi:transposase
MGKKIYPSLLKVATDCDTLDTNSWFDIIERKNGRFRKQPKGVIFNNNYIDTMKIKLTLTKDQQNKIKSWMNTHVDAYNLTNDYIKKHLKSNYSNFSTLVNFYRLRQELTAKIAILIKKTKMHRNCCDYAVKQCVEMYKSAYSNYKNGNIKKFRVRKLKKNKRRRNIVVEPKVVNSSINSIFVRQLGEIKSSLPLNIIERNSLLRYDDYKKTFIIITPIDKSNEIELKQYKKCGVDIGVRTFMTVYSKEVTYEIGTNTCGTIDAVNSRLDKLNTLKDIGEIDNKTYVNAYTKYADKLKNKITDMHCKVSNFLMNKFNIINIGKVSTKKMVSNLRGTLHDKVKRRLMALSHYKFRMKLQQMKDKYNVVVNEIDEYMTSKKCCKCSNIHQNLGSNKEYNCSNCNLKIDRDINASINIYDL